MSTVPALSELKDEIAILRRFNRLYARVIREIGGGVVENSAYSLTEARILYELAGAEAMAAKQIAAELDVDAGYLSRILKTFEEAGLVEREVCTLDGRHVWLKLTARGKRAVNHLSEYLDRQAFEMLEKLSLPKRSHLLRSMQTIEEVLTSKESEPYVLRQHEPGDMGWVVSRHGALYAQEYGWDEHFEALVARIVADFISGFDPKRERCWIAERHGERLGCIFLVKHPGRSEMAKLRLLLVEPGARGMGIGKALVRECIQYARQAEYKKITLWTQSILTSAQHLYRQAGFKLVKEEPHYSFSADLVGQTWELKL